MAKEPQIGRHLAALNLFREDAETVEITVASHTPALMAEANAAPWHDAPIGYIEQMIVQAAERMARRNGNMRPYWADMVEKLFTELERIEANIAVGELGKFFKLDEVAHTFELKDQPGVRWRLALSKVPEDGEGEFEE